MHIKNPILTALFFLYYNTSFTMIGRCDFVHSHSKQEIEEALNAGIDINIQDDWGDTALIEACCYGYKDIVQFLVDNKADINKKNNNGRSPLSVASEFGYTEIVQILLTAGAQVNTTDNDHNTPLHCAVSQGFPNSDTPRLSYSCMDTVSLLLKAGAHVNAQTAPVWKSTPLHLAVYRNNLDLIKLLITYGADITMENNNKLTPLKIVKTQKYQSLAIICYLEDLEGKLKQN